MQRGRRRLAAIAVVGTALLLGVPGAMEHAVAAGLTRYVSPAGDDSENDCTDSTSPCLTVQHAIEEADAGDTVQIDAGTYDESINVSKPLTLIGAGVGQTIINGDHDDDESVFIDGIDADTPIVVTIQGISVDGNVDSDGISVGAAELHLVDSSASSNDGDGVFLATTASVVTIEGSTVSGNGGDGVDLQVPFSDATDAAAVAAADDATNVAITASDLSDNDGDGAFVEDGSVAIDHSTFHGNGGSGYFGFDASATVTRSTFDANDGGGIGLFDGTAAIVASTIAGNTFAGAYATGGEVTVTASTITGTVAPDSTNDPTGGLVATAIETLRPAALASSFTVSSSIVANQAEGVPDCSMPVDDGGYNLSSDDASSCGFSTDAHSQSQTDPVLGALGDNGGPTLTQVPLKGSPAIDAIPTGEGGCVDDSTDQRDIARPQPVDGACDIGAVELEADPIEIHPDSLPDATVGTAYSVTLMATGGAYPTYTFSLAPGSALPDGLSLDESGHLTGTPTVAGTYSFTVSVNDPVLQAFTLLVRPAQTSTSTTTTTTTAPAGVGSVTTTNGLPRTGAPVWPIASTGILAIVGGLLLLLGAAWVRPRGKHVRRR